MNDTQPSFMPGRAPASSAGASAAANHPTAMPPAAAARAKGDCGCNGSAASGPAAGGMLVAGSASASTAPSLRPATTAAGAVTATWQSNVHVAGMWSINQDRNAWVYLDTVGWRKLSDASESGAVAMNMIAAHAYQMGSTSSLYEGDDGRIEQLYVW
jgi:hypothetical protein